METWVVLVEAAAAIQDTLVDPAAVESLLTFFDEESPLGLYAPDRYALQVWTTAERPEHAIAHVLDRWRSAAAEAGLGRCTLARAEIMTAAEMEAETQAKWADGVTATATAWQRLEAVEAVHETTRTLLRARSPKEAAQAVVALVHRLGGSVVLGDGAHPYRLPLDLSFGEGPPIAPAAPPHAGSRLLLEELLPGVIADAWLILAERNGADSAKAGRMVRQQADVEVIRDRALESNRRWPA